MVQPLGRLAATIVATGAVLLVSGALHAQEARRPAELYLGLGIGNAVCGSDRPDSDCPVRTGGAFALGGGWRFHPHWLVGLELAAWGFGVNESWRGRLADDATDVEFSSSYIAPFVRWYWFDRGTADPYLMGGFGLGSVRGEASNDDATYTYTSSGPVYLLGIGVEWQLAKIFRLGPQALAYIHYGTEICEDATGGDEACRDPGEDAYGDREGVALPYRLTINGTFTLGSR
jgi:hypothetical protein